jgi:saccharopine dehydrogenase (NADP+, L-glutamate forming)/spermidine synthase
MKNILVLGGGLVAKPTVNYLLDKSEFNLVVADMIVSKAEALVGYHPRGKATALNVTDLDALEDQIKAADLVVSLVPYEYHYDVAKLCIKHRSQMVTASYVSAEMNSLDEDAKAAGLTILNEMGLDPGIDHMSAMRIINDVASQGGKITSFRSFCGGLPAPEARDNPFGYKFSWSPIGVVMAGKNSAYYLQDGEEVCVDGPDLFGHYFVLDIEGAGAFETYPNRDSMRYIDIYGLRGIQTMYRGTLRNLGWCDTWKAMVDVGLLGDTERPLEGKSFKEFVGGLLPGSPKNGVKEAVAKVAGRDPEGGPIKKMEWLGLFSDDPVPMETASPTEVLAHLLMEKLQYAPGERDMIVLHHEFVAEMEKGRSTNILSTMVEYGIPNGDSIMSRTVGLPAAIAARYILEGKIDRPGVQIPVSADIYDPVLDELGTQGISFEGKTEKG